MSGLQLDLEHLLWGLLAGAEKSFSSNKLRHLWRRLAEFHYSLIDCWKQPEILEQKLGFTNREVFALHGLKQANTLAKFKQHLLANHWQVLLYSDQFYPPLLRQIPDYPVVIFLAGNPECLTRPSLAVVGSRKNSDYGRLCVRNLINSNLQGYNLVSGLMTGIDALAHQRALSQGITTVAVLGYGFDYLYPHSMANLKRQILQSEGAIISEYAPNLSPTAWRFPKRNRLVAGMSMAVLVIEAALKSGSLITARLATEYDREVLAVPGAINQPLSAGVNTLIQHGAVPITSDEEIMAVLNNSTLKTLCSISPPISAPVKKPENQTEIDDPLFKQIYRYLQTNAYSVDELAAKLNLPVIKMQTTVSFLELTGVVQRSDTGKLMLVL